MASTLIVDTLQPRTGSQITLPAGKTIYAPGHMIQMATANTNSNVSGTSTSWTTLWTVSITGITSTSKVIVDMRVTNLIEGSEECEWKIVRASDGVAICGSLIHRSASLSGWGHSYPNLIGVDTAPSAGTNSYSLQVRGVGATPHYWWNYPGVNAINSYTYATITEVAQ
jgi:hypothetical protein